MTYQVLILKRAQKELADLPKDIYERIKSEIFILSNTPRPQGCIKLSGRDGWRIREENYRIIYEINDETKTVLILHIGHRKDVYQ